MFSFSSLVAIQAAVKRKHPFAIALLQPTGSATTKEKKEKKEKMGKTDTEKKKKKGNYKKQRKDKELAVDTDKNARDSQVAFFLKQAVDKHINESLLYISFDICIYIIWNRWSKSFGEPINVKHKCIHIRFSRS